MNDQEATDEYIRRVVDAAPPLTDAQRAELAALLSAGTTHPSSTYERKPQK